MKIDEVTLTKARTEPRRRKNAPWRWAGSGQTESQPSGHTGHEKNFSPMGQPHHMCLNNYDQCHVAFSLVLHVRAGHVGRFVDPYPKPLKRRLTCHLIPNQYLSKGFIQSPTREVSQVQHIRGLWKCGCRNNARPGLCKGEQGAFRALMLFCFGLLVPSWLLSVLQLQKPEHKHRDPDEVREVDQKPWLYAQLTWLSG